MSPANFEEKEVSGTQTGWTRCKGFTGSNEYKGTPAIVFHNEKIKCLPDTTLVKLPHAETRVAYTPGNTFPLRNPDTNEIVGEMTDDILYAAIYSKWYAEIGGQ